MNKLAETTSEYLVKDRPEFNIGDTISVHVHIIEGEKERTQVFKGIVIQQKNGGIDKTFTVRKISHGVGVERIFLLNSPKISKISVEKRGRVRRAKLYYLRELKGKAARVPGKK